MSDAPRTQPAIPLSPPSPPADGVKEISKPGFTNYTPNSPASPFMSIAAKNYARSFTDTQASSSSDIIPRSPSPPTSVPMSTQVSQQPGLMISTPFPMPDNIVIGQTRKALDELGNEHVKKRPRIDESPLNNGLAPAYSHSDNTGSMLVSNIALTKTEVESPDGRQPAGTKLAPPEANAETLPAWDEMSLDQLQKNVGQVFHLCKSAMPRIRPDPSQHLLSIYGLTDLHSKVARTDPVTHEKINKLRRSYEGHIKTFELAGRNKPVKDEIPEGQWSSLNMMMLEPDESWNASKVVGKKIGVTPDLGARLQKAMSLQPGRVKDHEYWADLLGQEAQRTTLSTEITGKKSFSTGTQRAPVNGSATRTMSQAANEVARPRRSGKKRSYADNSFEGYGDGFVDDEAVDVERGSLSNSEDENHGPGRKKRKKEHSFSGPIATYGGASSYGVGGWNGGDR